MNSPSQLLGGLSGAVNVGLESFAETLRSAGATVTHVEWRPPAQGDPATGRKIALLTGDPAVEGANATAVERMLAARPMLTDVRPASEVLPELHGERVLLHAGPPIEWERMSGPMRAAVTGAALLEGWAATPQEAEDLADRGGIQFSPCHHHRAVGPMAGIISATMPVMVIEDASTGQRAYSNLNEGQGRCLRYGALGSDVLDRLAWMRDRLGPSLAAALHTLGEPVDLAAIIAQALQMGDECHSRNVAASALLVRQLAPALARHEQFGGIEALEFLSANNYWFLNFSMAASKLAADAGRAFWLVHDAASGRQWVLNATGRAGRAASPGRYQGHSALPVRGPESAITVPGAVDGWFAAHQRFGRLPFGDCLAPAIEYADGGFPVSPGLARWLAASRDLLAQWPATAACFLRPDGSPYREGETMRLPALAATLAAVATSGRAAFYEGDIARRIAGSLSEHGGVLDRDDFGSHESDWVEPIRARYRGWDVLTTPPNSQGLATLEILGLAHHFDVAALADNPAGYIDLLARATRAAFTDRDRYLTDPRFSDVPVADLLDPGRLAALPRSLTVGPPADAGATVPSAGDTTFSCAADADGTVTAVIQSIYFEWGSGFVAGDTGVLLQNRGSFFP